MISDENVPAEKMIQNVEVSVFTNPVCKQTYQALPKIYGNMKYQRNKVILIKHNPEPRKHTCLHLQSQHLQSQKQINRKINDIDVNYSAQRLSKPKVDHQCNKKLCYCNLNFELKKNKRQRYSSVAKNPKKLPKIIGLETQPDDMESQHKVFKRSAGYVSALSPSGLDALVNYHRPSNLKNKTVPHAAIQHQPITHASFNYQPLNYQGSNHEEISINNGILNQTLKEDKILTNLGFQSSDYHPQKKKNNQNNIPKKKKFKYLNRKIKKNYQGEASKSNSENEEQQHKKIIRYDTQPKQQKRSQSRSSVSISNLVFKNKVGHTMFHENSKKALEFQKKSQIRSIKSNGLFKIPTESQYVPYLKHYKPLDPNFKIKKLLQKLNFNIIEEENSVYFGQIENDQKNGEGILVTEKQIFEGKWNNNLKIGGYERNIDGVYQGEFINGLRSGHGIFRWNNGEIFEGQWKQGSKNGYGVWTSPKGDRYQGEWVKNRQNGKGKFKHQNNTYIGEFKNFLKHGKGQEIFNNGDHYIGEYKQGKPHGKGTYKWKDGGEYIGQFVNGLRQGKGKWTDNESIYEGYFKQDYKDGQGVEIYKSGDKFVGYFKEGNKKSGKMYGINGNVIQIMQ